MRRILQPIRVLGTILMVLTYLTHMSLMWMTVRERWRQVRRANEILSFYSKVGLWILNVKVRALGLENVAANPNALFVGNHLSYMDVLAIASQRSACFVTSTEVKNSFGLGLICRMAGCLFVERRNKHNILNEVRELTEGLNNGLNVAIFPEATSTNGEKVLRFRRPLYLSAIQSQRPIIPICLNYHTINGQPIDLVTRDSIFWYGDMDFVPHLWALAGSGGVLADIHFLPPVQTKLDSDATKLAELTQSMVEGVFQPVRH